jgi:uncharacterized protein YecE (DUF72 family)
MFRVGTSGWQYRDWRERFYPKGLPTSRWLEHYAARFSTVEVNNSFYRLPERERVEAWAREVPDGFVLTMKASRYITHIRRLKDPEEPLTTMWRSFLGAGDRLGPVLFQLPPNLPADVERLRAFVALLPAERPAALEFRHDSWLTDEVFALLDGARASLVWPDRPGTRRALPLTGGWAYVRFHQGSRTGPDYPRAKLRRWADRLAELGAVDGYAYFNNDTGGAAVRDAETFRDLLAERGLDVV